MLEVRIVESLVRVGRSGLEPGGWSVLICAASIGAGMPATPRLSPQPCVVTVDLSRPTRPNAHVGRPVSLAGSEENQDPETRKPAT